MSVVSTPSSGAFAGTPDHAVREQAWVPAGAAGTDMRAAFERDVFLGLSARPKRLPSKYFYDARGSALFERICEQPEYYLTRTELAIMQAHAGDMAAALGPDLRLVELGCGAGHKTRLLLAALDRPRSYVPVDISRSALRGCVSALRRDWPAMSIEPLCADFAGEWSLPASTAPTAVYFPGSTLGNLDHGESRALLRALRTAVGDDGAALVGLDLKKSVDVLEAAYNDAAGVTAAFTLNLLVRINRELGGDFDAARFEHRARYAVHAGRIETQLVSRDDQSLAVGQRRFAFVREEAIDVEISCKYSLDDVERMADDAGWRIDRFWTDAARWFGVFLLRPATQTAEFFERDGVDCRTRLASRQKHACSRFGR